VPCRRDACVAQRSGAARGARSRRRPRGAGPCPLRGARRAQASGV